MDSPPEGLIVTALDTIGLTRLPHILADGALSVTVLGPSRLAIAQSRFVSKHIKTEDNVPAVLHTLKEHLAGQPPYAYICLGDDALVSLSAVERSTEWLSPWFPTDLNRRALDFVAYKHSMTEQLYQAGVRVPAYQILTGNGMAVAARQSLPGKVILKRSPIWPSFITTIESGEPLEPALQSLSGQGPVLMQKFIQGRLACTSVLFKQGRPICWFSYFLLKNWPTAFAPATAVQIMDHPEIKSNLARIGAITGFNGFAGIDWMLEETTGQLYCLEQNSRPIPATYLGSLAGVQFSKAVRHMLGTTETVQEPSPTAIGHYRRMFPQHLYAATADRDWLGWLSTLHDAPWPDIRLVGSHGRRWMTHYTPAKSKTAIKKLINALTLNGR